MAQTDRTETGRSADAPMRVANGAHEAMESRIAEGVASLCAGLGGLMRSLPTPARRATDLVRGLGVDAPLASRLFRLSQATDPAEAVEMLPTLNQLRRAVERASAAAPGEAAERAQSVLADFEALVDELGGDQRGFESLVSMLSPTGIRRVEIQHRKDAFRANTHLWGMCAETVSYLVVQRPGQDPHTVDLSFVYGYVGARTIRPNVQFRLRSRLRLPGEPPPDPAAPTAAAGFEPVLMPEFSTVRAADISHLPPESDGFAHSLVQLAGHRPSDAVTLFARADRPGLKINPGDFDWNTGFLVTWPATNLHIDLVAPAGTTVPGTLSLSAYARNDNVPAADRMRPQDRVPLHETARHLGQIRKLPPVPGVPRLPEIFESTVKHMGMHGAVFDVYRVHIEYPMLHAMVRVHVKLREGIWGQPSPSPS